MCVQDYLIVEQKMDDDGINKDKEYFSNNHNSTEAISNIHISNEHNSDVDARNEDL